MGLFNAFNNNEKNKYKSYIKNLLEVAIVDGDLDKSELELVISIASKFDISKKTVLEIKENPGTVTFNPPSSYSAKIKLIEDLVKVMMIDKSVEEKEVQICREFALKLKISTVIIDDIILSISSSSNN